MRTPHRGGPEDDQDRAWSTSREERPAHEERHAREDRHARENPATGNPPMMDNRPARENRPVRQERPAQEGRPSAPSHDPYRGNPWPTALGTWPVSPADRQARTGQTQEPPATPPAPARSRPTPPQRRQPPGDGQWTPAPLRIFPDEQVWPPKPPEEEPAEVSTQPFPSISALPLPRPSVTGTGTGTGKAAAVAVPADDVPAQEPSAPKTPPRRGRRTALRVGGAIVAVGLGIAASTWSGYTVYRTGNPADRIHTVAAGGAMTLMHVSWKASVEQVDDLPGQKPLPPDRQWLKIKVTRTALDAEGVSLRGDPEVEMRHSDGRVWKVLPESDDIPDEVKDHRVGTAYSYDMISVVPRHLAGQVEVHVRPATFHVVENQPVEDILKKAAAQKDPVRDQVLRFRR
ncbi:hypothetical protein [Streptosporangium sp. NPDC049046]|uniref:hypothetical protein n=1 Tax=unclassified Streptosporangium TaxID=2632669 RepID=UPI0034273D5F